LSRRLPTIFLAVVLIAAQGIALSHALDHSLQAESDSCWVCHIADNFDHGSSGDRAPEFPAFASLGALIAPVVAHPTCVPSAHQARAPPVYSS
jgi:hypothetical protein